MATEMKRVSGSIDRIEELLGNEARTLLDHRSQAIPKEQLYLPGPDFVDRVVSQTDRSPAVLRSLQSLISHGRLAATGYGSILPVDQGVEHAGGASCAPNPQYFDPDNMVTPTLRMIELPAFIGWTLLGVWIATIRIRINLVKEQKLAQ